MKKYIILFLLLASSTVAYTSTIYTANNTYTSPANVHYVLVEAWGGGGGGGSAGGGGGGGAYSRSILYISNSSNYTVTVGAGGGGGTAGAYGFDGGSSWFNSTGTILAAGGGGGGGSGSGRVAGAAGSAGAGIGQIKYSGGSGSAGIAGAPYNGAGGGGAGNLEDGASASGTSGGLGGLYGGGGGANSSGNLGAVSGGGGSGGSAATGGSGGRGQVVVYESENPFSEVNFTVRDANSLVLIPTLVNITLQSNELVNYVFNTTSGFLNTYLIEPGVYNVQLIAYGYPTTYGVLTVVANESVSSTYYLDSSAEAISYTLTDTLGNVVSNATVTFNRNIGGSIVVFTQLTTDFSGLFTVNLNPSATYSLVIIDPTGQRDPFYGTVINPNPATTYNIVMQIASGSGYNFTLSDIYTRYNATYFNSTNKINVTFEVTAFNGSLDYFMVNTTYGVTEYRDNISSSPGGGIAFVEINNTNLTIQDTIYVEFTIKKTGYNSVSFIYPFKFFDIAPQSSSINNIFDVSNSPSSNSGKAILATIILVICIAGAYAFSRDQLFTTVFGIVVLMLLTFNNMYPLLFGIMTLAIVGIIIIGKAVR